MTLMHHDFEIAAARKEDIAHVLALFEEYAGTLGFDLGFQRFEEELATLPGPYSPPEGALFLARALEELVGCAAMRRFSADTCEMKRLYVRSAFRGRGIGRKLSLAAIASAREAGYKHMRLDTVPWMQEAIALYRSLGFVEMEPYRPNPISGAIYMELGL